MGVVKKIYILSTLLLGIGIFLNFTIMRIPEVPKVEDKYWGPGQSSHEVSKIVPFEINISNDVSN